MLSFIVASYSPLTIQNNRILFNNYTNTLYCTRIYTFACACIFFTSFLSYFKQILLLGTPAAPELCWKIVIILASGVYEQN